MPRPQVQLLPVVDFTGGLNLRDDAFQLAPNEIPQCSNVRVLPQGGTERRRSVQRLNTSALSSTPANIWQFLGNSVTHILVQQGNDAAYSTGTATFTSINPDALTLTGKMRAATMRRLSSNASQRNYIQRNAEQVAWKWDGSSATVLGDSNGAYNDNLASPAGGRMPKAKYIVSHGGFMWNASTVEGANTFESRVRWSHPGEPEDYRTNDFIDVAPGVDGDVITGLAPFADRLIVFKNRSVHQITGYSPDTFAVEKLVDNIGAVSQEAISVGEFGVAFYDGQRGVYLYDGKNFRWLWEKLDPALVAASVQDKVAVGWLDRRLFVSVATTGNSTNTVTYVYDPVAGKGGAWYQYDYGVGAFLFWRPNNTTQLLLGTSPTTGYVWQLESGVTTDNFGSADASFTSSFTTSWFDARLPGARKRWRRPVVILDNEADTELFIETFRDYDTVSVNRSFYIETEAESGGLSWGGNWGENWYADADGTQALKRGSGLGRAYAVQLKVNGPTSHHWNVNAIVLKYMVLRIR